MTDRSVSPPCGKPTDWPGRTCHLFGGHPGRCYPATDHPGCGDPTCNDDHAEPKDEPNQAAAIIVAILGAVAQQRRKRRR